jgi:hypothetical protein
LESSNGSSLFFSEQIHTEKQMAAPAPVAAISSNKLIVSNDAMDNNLVNIDDDISSTKRSVSGRSSAR